MPFETLQNLLTYVLNNPYARVYRDLYKESVDPTVIHTKADWERVPIIDKEFLAHYPFWERIHTARTYADCIRGTSGTSTNKPFVCSRSVAAPYLPPYIQNFTVTGLLSVSTLPAFIFENEFAHHGIHAPALMCDLGNLDASIRLAADASVNIIQCASHLIHEVLPLLHTHRLANNIRLFLTGGEVITQSTFTELQQQLPNARILNGHGMVEVQGYASFAEHVDPRDNMFLHAPIEGQFFFELADENGAVITDSDVEGEILLTTLRAEGNEMPLIRYKTGDIATTVRDRGRTYYKLLGRKEVDSIKVRGGMVSVHALNRIMQTYHLEDAYQAVYFSGEENNASLPYISIRIATPPKDIVLDELAHKIAELLPIGPHTSYADAVTDGLFQALRCTIEEPEKVGVKTRKLLKK